MRISVKALEHMKKAGRLVHRRKPAMDRSTHSIAITRAATNAHATTVSHMLDVDLVNLRAKLYSFTTVQGTTISVLKSSFVHLLAVWQKRKGGVGGLLRRLVDALHLHLRTHSQHTKVNVTQVRSKWWS
jgi:hypothetical protein